AHGDKEAFLNLFDKLVRGPGKVHNYPYRYTYTGSSELKRDEYNAVIFASKGAYGEVTGRFLRGRECGGTYHTPSHINGLFTHRVYISKKNSHENIAEVVRLKTLCDRLETRQTEIRNSKDQLQREILRLQDELTNRRDDEERRIREQAEARRLMIENRRIE